MAMLPPDPVYIFKGEMVGVSCIIFKFTETIQRIYAGTQSGNVHVWNLKNKRETGKFKAGSDTCLSISIPEKEDLVITHVKSGYVSFWKETDNHWELEKQIKINFFGFCKCQLFDEVLFAPVKDSKCELISVTKMEKQKTIQLNEGNSGDIMAFKVFVVYDRKVVLVAYEGLQLGLWDLGQSKRISFLPLEECPMAIDYNVKSNKGLCGNPTDKIIVFSLDKNLEFRLEKSISLTNAGVAAVSIRPDGKLAAVGCWDGKLRLYSWKSLVLLAVLDTHSATVQDVCFAENRAQDGKVTYVLAAGSQDSRISLWDLYN